MSKKTMICFLAIVVVSLPLISCSPAIAIKDHPLYQQARQMVGDSSKPRSIAWPYDPILNSLCANNLPGDYQNPYFCDLYIMCAAGGEVFLQVCPGDLIFDPVADECVYRPIPPNKEQCPWPSIWNDASNVRCDTLGQVPFWSPITFPVDSNECCGKDIMFCNKYSLLGYSECNDGYRYSKAFLACLPKETCERVDKEFNLCPQ